LSDGEGMERLWSYLRRFGRMTKEMRPAHRVSVLSHALAYYGLRKKQRLCECAHQVYEDVTVYFYTIRPFSGDAMATC